MKGRRILEILKSIEFEKQEGKRGQKREMGKERTVRVGGWTASSRHACSAMFLCEGSNRKVVNI